MQLFLRHADFPHHPAHLAWPEFDESIGFLHERFYAFDPSCRRNHLIGQILFHLAHFFYNGPNHIHHKVYGAFFDRRFFNHGKKSLFRISHERRVECSCNFEGDHTDSFKDSTSLARAISSRVPAITICPGVFTLAMKNPADAISSSERPSTASIVPGCRTDASCMKDPRQRTSSRHSLNEIFWAA